MTQGGHHHHLRRERSAGEAHERPEERIPQAVERLLAAMFDNSTPFYRFLGRRSLIGVVMHGVLQRLAPPLARFTRYGITRLALKISTPLPGGLANSVGRTRSNCAEQILNSSPLIS